MKQAFLKMTLEEVGLKDDDLPLLAKHPHVQTLLMRDNPGVTTLAPLGGLLALTRLAAPRCGCRVLLDLSPPLHNLREVGAVLPMPLSPLP